MGNTHIPKDLKILFFSFGVSTFGCAIEVVAGSQFAAPLGQRSCSDFDHAGGGRCATRKRLFGGYLMGRGGVTENLPPGRNQEFTLGHCSCPG